jgi:hypothetical protein
MYSFNANMTPEIYERNPGLHWNVSALARNPNFPLQYVAGRFGNGSLGDYYISINPHVTWEMVASGVTPVSGRPSAWDFKALASNLFTKAHYRVVYTNYHVNYVWPV